jgi:glycosyltransferase involved in cell wall biosynthesis
MATVIGVQPDLVIAPGLGACFTTFRENPRPLFKDAFMRALFLDRLPNAVPTADNAGTVVNGVRVANAAFTKALLRYGTYDRYFYVRESAMNAKAESYGCDERLTPLDLGSLESLRTAPPDELVLFTATQHIAKFVPFRQFCQHLEWPICGLGQVLSSNDLIPGYLWNYFSALASHDAIVCASQSARDALSRIMGRLANSSSVDGQRSPWPVRLPLIPLGVELPERVERNIRQCAAGFVVLLIGRFSANHKADLRPVISAFLHSDELPGGSTLILAGDDTQFGLVPGLQEFAASIPSRHKIVFFPDKLTSTKASLLAMADVALCLTDTYHETFGLSVLDAMAAGLPVVAPDWDGYRDLVVHEETGFLAPTAVCEDTGLLSAVSLLVDPSFVLGQRTIVDVDQMVSWLALLGTHPEIAREMGAGGRRRVEAQFTWRRVIAMYEALWRELLTAGKDHRHSVSPATAFGFLDYVDAFQSYPSLLLQLNTRVTVNPAYVLGQAHGESPSFTPPPCAGFSSELDEQILQVCAMEPPIALNDLVGALASQRSSASMVITQVSRLAKYGLLSLHPAVDTDRKERCDERAPDFALSASHL